MRSFIESEKEKGKGKTNQRHLLFFAETITEAMTQAINT